MTLIDRYVGEVARRIPRRQRADVARELTSSLLDALDNRFGPTASEEDAATLLRELGPPETVAASYRPSSQYLIGPAWYPTFSLVVRIHLASLLAVLAVGAFLLIAVTPAGAVGGLTGLIGGLLHYGLLGLGVITLVFHLLERGDVRSPRDADLLGKTWDPQDLPIAGRQDRIGRGEAAFVVVMTALALVALHQFHEYIGIWWAGDAPLLDKVVRANVPWLTAVWVLTMPLYVLLAWQGHWRWYTRSWKLGVDVLFLYLVYRVAAALLAEEDAWLAAGFPPNSVTWFVWTAILTAVIAAAVVLFDDIRTLIRSWRDREDDASPDGAVSTRGVSR